jgi:hypothetical protein
LRKWSQTNKNPYFSLIQILGSTKAFLFAECQGQYSRQRTYTGAQVLVLCRVLWSWHSAKHLFAECYTRQSDQYTPFLFIFPIPAKQTKDISQISHIYITDHHKHKYPTQTLIYKFSTQTVSTQVQKYQHKFRSINT